MAEEFGKEDKEDKKDDEKRYLDWVARHPDGFVANMDRKGNFPQYPMVHAATHGLISSSKIGNFTTGDYFKICSDSLEDLEAYARTHYGRKLTFCRARHCVRKFVQTGASP